MTKGKKQTVTRVRSGKEIRTKQNLSYFLGISKETAGATGISMNIAVIPPGGAAEPHYHKDFEAAIYLLEGEVETRFGEGLKESIVTEKGDFLFIPAGVPHQPFNQSDKEPAVAIVARNDPSEQENVVLVEKKEK